jgi:asp_kinases: aspartate kinase
MGSCAKLSVCADKNKTDSVKGKTMLIVKKFGGTSVGDKQRMYNVANRCIEEYKKEMTWWWFVRHGKIYR